MGIQLTVARALRKFLIVTALLLTFTHLSAPTPVQAACTLGGFTYRDYNDNGTQDAGEPTLTGIRVTAYDSNNQIVGSATTDATGSYQMTIGAVVATSVRVEFTGLPDYLRSARFGSNSLTTVTFADCNGGTSTVDFGAVNPSDYCHTNAPDLATSCYVVDDQLSGLYVNEPTFIEFPYTATGDQPHQTLATAQQIGTTFGLAYQRTSDSYFIGSFLKRYAGFGPDATGSNPTSGAIYRINRSTGAVSVFMDLNTYPAALQTGADPHPTSRTSCGPNAFNNCWMYDSNSYNLVGKLSLGDLEISENDRTLFAVNLATRELLEIPIGIPPTAPPAGQIRRHPLNQGTLPGLVCPSADDVRPFGLGVQDGRVYVGVVCSAESTQNVNDLRAFVYSADENAVGAFQQDLNIPLNYTRRCADSAPNCLPNRRAAWQPWTTQWPTPVQPGPAIVHPEPMLTDIVFDRGDMILGFRDRMGDRTGNQRPGPFDLTSMQLAMGIAAGDTLRACSNGAGSWTLEDNAACGGQTTAGANTNQGPGGGEFYFEDTNNPNGTPRHDEISLGGLVQVPGNPSVAVTVFDPLCEGCAADPLFDGGVRWFDNTTGATDQSYRIYNGTGGGPGNNFGKANGVGDLEAVCGPMPLEIGNRVWEDLNNNGTQDPGEPPIPGVVVQLYMDTDGDGKPDRLVGRTTTDAQGEYYFNESDVFTGVLGGPVPGVNFYDINGDGQRQPNEPAGVMPNTAYEIRLDDPANYNGGPLTPFYATTLDADPLRDTNGDMRDSDGKVPAPLQKVSTSNIPVHALTTGDFGDNNHTYDFGFVRTIVTRTPPIQTSVANNGSLILEKGVDKPFAGPGDTVTWTITVTNPTSAAVPNVEVGDTLGSEFQIVSANAPKGTVSINGQTVTLTIPQLNPGESVTLTIVTKVRSDAPASFVVDNEAHVSPGGITASARLIGVTELPATGETPWWRLPALVFGAGGILVLLILGLRLRRR
jgi:uncharacterized repeat protein (TIGR01451 family)